MGEVERPPRLTQHYLNLECSVMVESLLFVKVVFLAMQNFLVYYRAMESRQESRLRTCDDVNWALAILNNTALLKIAREAHQNLGQ